MDYNNYINSYTLQLHNNMFINAFFDKKINFQNAMDGKLSKSDWDIIHNEMDTKYALCKKLNPIANKIIVHLSERELFLTFSQILKEAIEKKTNRLLIQYPESDLLERLETFIINLAQFSLKEESKEVTTQLILFLKEITEEYEKMGEVDSDVILDSHSIETIWIPIFDEFPELLETFPIIFKDKMMKEVCGQNKKKAYSVKICKNASILVVKNLCFDILKKIKNECLILFNYSKREVVYFTESKFKLISKDAIKISSSIQQVENKILSLMNKINFPKKEIQSIYPLLSKIEGVLEQIQSLTEKLKWHQIQPNLLRNKHDIVNYLKNEDLKTKEDKNPLKIDFNSSEKTVDDNKIKNDNLLELKNQPSKNLKKECENLLNNITLSNRSILLNDNNLITLLKSDEEGEEYRIFQLFKKKYLMFGDEIAIRITHVKIILESVNSWIDKLPKELSYKILKSIDDQGKISLMTVTENLEFIEGKKKQKNKPVFIENKKNTLNNKKITKKTIKNNDDILNKNNNSNKKTEKTKSINKIKINNNFDNEIIKISEEKSEWVTFSFKIDDLPSLQKKLTLKLNNLIETSEGSDFTHQIKEHFFDLLALVQILEKKELNSKNDFYLLMGLLHSTTYFTESVLNYLNDQEGSDQKKYITHNLVVKYKTWKLQQSTKIENDEIPKILKKWSLMSFWIHSLYKQLTDKEINNDSKIPFWLKAIQEFFQEKGVSSEEDVKFAIMIENLQTDLADILELMNSFLEVEIKNNKIKKVESVTCQSIEIKTDVLTHLAEKCMGFIKKNKVQDRRTLDRFKQMYQDLQILLGFSKDWSRSYSTNEIPLLVKSTLYWQNRVVERLIQILMGLQSEEICELDVIHDFNQIIKLFKWKNKPNEFFYKFIDSYKNLNNISRFPNSSNNEELDSNKIIMMAQKVRETPGYEEGFGIVGENIKIPNSLEIGKFIENRFIEMQDVMKNVLLPEMDHLIK
jgi:hypothetical protein